jgi:hypothetical protein
MSRCSHPLCTSRHSGKYRIAELCPLAQEKRRASWRAYEDHLHQAHLRTYAERFGEPGTETWLTPTPGTETGLGTTGTWLVTKRIKIRNPAVTLDMRLSLPPPSEASSDSLCLASNALLRSAHRYV